MEGIEDNKLPRYRQKKFDGLKTVKLEIPTTF